MWGNCWGYPMMGYWGGGWVGPIIMIIWWFLVIAAVIFLVRWLAWQSRLGERDGKIDALRILKERYAKGEINKEQFEKMKKDLA